jgi:hypothetical protein
LIHFETLFFRGVDGRSGRCLIDNRDYGFFVSFRGPFGFDIRGQFEFVVMSFLFGSFGVDIVGLRSEYSLPNGFVMKRSSRGGFGTSSKDIYDDKEFFIPSQQLEMCVRNKCGYYNDYAKVMTIGLQFHHQRKARCQRRTRQTISGKSRLPTMHSKSVSLRLQHGIALDSMGQIFCWGKGEQGQLGQGKYLAHEALEEMCLVVELTANPKHID